MSQIVEPRRLPRNVKRIILTSMASASTLVAASCSVESSCVRAGEHVVLTGIVASREVDRPPDLGDLPDVDRTRTVLTLRLKEPLDICRGRGGGVDGAPIRNVAEVQLVNHSGRPAELDEVTVSGVIQRARNADHYYGVVLLVD